MSESPFRAPSPMCLRCSKAVPAERMRHGMCGTCDAIRSIRVAATLNKRYGEIIKKQSYTQVEDLENAVGEAEQIYPEIWSHLDNAQAALKQEGIEVPRYDQVREQVYGAAITKVDVNESVQLLGGGVRKSVSLNHDGHHQALAADEILRTMLPDVDWAGMDRAEAAEIAAIGDIRPAAWKRALVAGIGFVLLAACAAVYIWARFS